MRASLPLLLLFFVSCQTAPLQYSLQDAEEHLNSRITELGSALDERVGVAVTAAREAVEEAKQARLAAGKPLEDPITWEEWILGGLGTVLTSILGTNLHRNHNRKLRGEPTGAKAT